jgi:P-type Cu+ transporter
MHYVPESAQDFLPDGERSRNRWSEAERSFHYQSAPLYLLTFVVGAMLGADLLLGMINDPTWTAYREPFGFRLALLAAVLGGARILYQTLEGLFEGRVGADLALTVAALAAIMLGEQMTAALVVFIALCGESIEGYTLDRAQSAIRRIFRLRPSLAHVVRDGREFDLPVDEVRVGDTVIIRPGERIAVDGVVTEGASAVDQSALTGESIPADKSVGDEVFTGTLNQYGSLSVEAAKVGSDTTLAKVVQLVVEATRQKTPLERTADRLARIFLPFVLGAALVTLIAWRLSAGAWSDGFRPALGVLVVACPCPLILATPTAVIAAMAWLARTGVVVKGSVALERLATIDAIAFDKTGTLTRGQLQLGEIFAVPPLDASELLRVAAIAERRSEHLLARLIVREAESRNMVIPPTVDFSSHPGAGVVAKVRSTVLGPWAGSPSTDDAASSDGPRTLIVGNRALMESQKVEMPAAITERIAHMEQLGATTLLVAVDQALLGAIGVRDAVREESRSVLAELKQAGVSSFALLTGDRAEAAHFVANSLGFIDAVEPALFPADKAKWIDTRIKEGRHVAMVGDGVNDAPALAAATVGLALGGVGSDLAAEAGDIVLMGDPLRPLPGLLRLSHALVRNIRESIFVFAFGANAVGMLLCGVGILSPVGGALFHEFASLAVMLNATRLLWFERWEETSLGRNWERLAIGAEWLSETLSPRRWVFRLIEHWSVVLGIAVPAVVLAWLLSGVILIPENERAIVTRFGRAESDLGPGLYWRYPAPFERIYREPVDRLRTVQIGFRASPDRPVSQTDVLLPVEWTSEHNEAGFETRPEESLVLTGDEVLVEMTAEVHWQISNLRQYLFDSARPVDTLRTLAESVVRETAARQPLDGILTDRRRQIEDDCLATLRARLQHDALGIEAVDLTLLDVHPPRAVVAAYRDVADALEEQEQRVNEAEAYYSGKLLSVAGERAVRLLDGTASDLPKRSDQSTTGGVSNWTLTDELWARLGRETPAGNMALSGEAAGILLTARQAATTTTQTARGDAARFNELLSAYRSQPRLTTSQLYWQTIVDCLSNRPLTVIDPKAGDHKRLFLGGPEDLKAGALIRDAESENAPPNARSQPLPNRLSPDQAPADRDAPERPEEPEQPFIK